MLTQETDFTGDHLISQHVRQYQTGKAYQVNVQDKKIVFETFDFDGMNETPSTRDKTKTEDLEEPFLTGPVSDSFLRTQWNQLMSGETVHARLGVLELAETVGFKFWKVDSVGKLITFRMKPSSIFIGLAVNPIDLLFDPTTKLMMGYIGRTPLRLMDHEKLVPFDGEVIYQ